MQHSLLLTHWVSFLKPATGLSIYATLPLLTQWVSFLKPATGLSTYATLPLIDTVGKFLESSYWVIKTCSTSPYGSNG
jgi:hypothetical protein